MLAKLVLLCSKRVGLGLDVTAFRIDAKPGVHHFRRCHTLDACRLFHHIGILANELRIQHRMTSGKRSKRRCDFNRTGEFRSPSTRFSVILIVHKMHESGLLLTLTVSLGAALALGFITQRLHLSPIVGYLLAGLIVGPYTPGFVADRAMATELAEIGIILMMFGVGLHFHLSDLLAVRKVAIPGAVAQSVAATVLGALTGHQFGWTWSASIVFGLALSVASTVMLTRVLVDNHALQTLTGRIAVGWLVVEDIFTIVVLVLLPAIFSDSGGVSVPYVLLVTLAKLAVLVAFVFVIGRRVIPRILTGVAATQSRELFTLSVLILALGIAVGSALGFGVSMALGAFLAGMIVGQSEFSLRAASEALPMRDAFSVLFFVSVGMLFDPRGLLDAPGMTAATLAVVMLGKPLVAIVIVLFLRQPPKVALAVAVALAQIGEFSFMLALMGTQLGVLPPSATNILVASAIFSITLNPLLYRAIDPIVAKASRRSKIWRLLEMRSRGRRPGRPAGEEGSPERDAVLAPDSLHRAIVVGYGPVGQTVTRLLRENEIRPTVIELNLETVRLLRKQGISAVYGDSSQRDTLKTAGIESAGNLILTSSAIHGSSEVIRLARELNPSIRVLA